tara:strand:- start:4161 stop:4706 length:546 start_codon:yes stop_codon:yes gene_type:complete
MERVDRCKKTESVSKKNIVYLYKSMVVKTECKDGKVRTGKNNRCVYPPKTHTRDKHKSECKDGKVRAGKNNRCINPPETQKPSRMKKTKKTKKRQLSDLFDSKTSSSTGLNTEDRKEFDGMLKKMAEPIGKGKLKSANTMPDLETCLASAPIEMLRKEMTRRGFKTDSPIINILVPRKKIR